MEPERSALVSSVSFWTATTLEGSGPMSDDTSIDDASVYELKAINNDQLRGASPEIKRAVNEVSGAPVDGGHSTDHPGGDVLQEHVATDAHVEQLENALLENWIHSSDGVTERREPRGHSVEAEEADPRRVHGQHQANQRKA